MKINFIKVEYKNFGSKQIISFEDFCDTVEIYISVSPNKQISFCAEAYHVEGWAKENGLDYQEVTKEFEESELFS